LTAALTLILVRVLRPSAYGVFALTVGISELVMVPADAGLTGAGSRFVAEHRDDAETVRRLVGQVTRLKLIALLLTAGVLVAVARPIANAYSTPALVWPLRAISLAMVGQSLLGFYAMAFMAGHRAAMTLQLLVAESVIEFSASAALVLLGAGATGAAAGRSVGYVTGALIGWVLVRRAFGRRRAAGEAEGAAVSYPSSRRLLTYAGALAAVNAVVTAIFQIDLLVIGAILGTVAVGVFQAPLKLTLFLAFPALAVAKAVAPSVSRAVGGTDRRPDAFAGTLRLMLISYAGVLAPIVVWARPISDVILGGGYAHSARVVQLLAPYLFLLGAATLLAEGVTYFGEARRRLAISVVALIVNAGLDLLLLPLMGVSGAAVATDAGFAVLVAGLLFICQTEIGLSLTPLLLTGARSLLAAVPVGLVLLALGGAHMSPPAAVAGTLLILPVFVAALTVSGEVRLEEVQGWRRALSGWASRARAVG
jgi:O-antigen/teichoic acid export membrane protein